MRMISLISNRLKIDLYSGRIAFSLIFSALMGHIVSAGAVYGIAHVSEEKIFRKRTSIVFLAGVIIRPVSAFHSYILRRLDEILHRAKYPRQDVLELTDEVSRLRETIKEQNRKIASLNDLIANLDKTKQKEYSDCKTLVNQYTTKTNAKEINLSEIKKLKSEFEGSIQNVDKDRKMLQGLKEFISQVWKQ